MLPASRPSSSSSSSSPRGREAPWTWTWAWAWSGGLPRRGAAGPRSRRPRRLGSPQPAGCSRASCCLRGSGASPIGVGDVHGCGSMPRRGPQEPPEAPAPGCPRLEAQPPSLSVARARTTTIDDDGDRGAWRSRSGWVGTPEKRKKDFAQELLLVLRTVLYQDSCWTLGPHPRSCGEPAAAATCYSFFAAPHAMGSHDGLESRLPHLRPGGLGPEVATATAPLAACERGGSQLESLQALA